METKFKPIRRLAVARVLDDAIEQGNGKKIGILAYPPPVNLETMRFEKISNIGKDDEERILLGFSDCDGRVIGKYITDWSIVNPTGGYDITFDGLDDSDVIYVSYDFQYELPVD